MFTAVLIRFVVKAPLSVSLPAARGERENTELSRNRISMFTTSKALTWPSFTVIYRFVKKVTYTISEAQANLPGLCRTGRRFVISRRDKPVYVAMPLADYDALLETMELLSNPRAMRALRAAQAGKLAYRELDLGDENFGL